MDEKNTELKTYDRNCMCLKVFELYPIDNKKIDTGIFVRYIVLNFFNLQFTFIISFVFG